MADILFDCGGCGRALEAPGEYAGMQVECPECGQDVTIPAESTGKAAETISFACTRCGKSVDAPGEYAGMAAECPECGATITIPDEADAPAADVVKEDKESYATPEENKPAPPKPGVKPGGGLTFRPGFKSGIGISGAKKPAPAVSPTTVPKGEPGRATEPPKPRLGFKKASVIQAPPAPTKEELPFQSIGNEKSQTIKIKLPDMDADFMQPSKRKISIRRRRK
ncbi:MAG: hypothetical protein EOL87_13405 [Spartobacteria bacterium]|nr:hypothetical protein [Spartobacteria bacterium]